jgi:predicted nucleic acid-binding protein
MAFIADASVAMAWILPDERDEAALSLLARTVDENLVVPVHWSGEVANGLLMAERRKRLTPETSNGLIARMADLDIIIDDEGIAAMFERILPLARLHTLTVYDAAYLELAERTGLELATFDRTLQSAAESIGVKVIA